jgi:hypothetical protein
MPWLFTIPEFVKKRACRYLLQHYLGQYLKGKIQLEDLTVDLYNGTGTITNVPLNVEAVNEALEGTGAPVQVVSGYLGRVTISVPWGALMSDSCRVEVTGLMISVMPCLSSAAGEDLATMTDSLFFGSNMTNSLQMAEEVMKSGPVEGEEGGRAEAGAEREGRAAFEGMEALARAIETVLSRVQIDLKETVVQLVCRSSDYTHQYFIRLRIQSIKFYDEERRGGGESSVDRPSPVDNPAEPGGRAAVETKILELSDITVEVGGVGEDIHTSTISPEDLPGVPVAYVSGGMNVTVKVRGTDSAPVPRVQVEAVVGGVHCLLAPSQLHILAEIASAALRSGGSTLSEFEQAGTGTNRPIPSGDLHGMQSQLQSLYREERRQRERRRDLLTADPYQGRGGGSRMTDSSVAVSPDMFYSLNLNESFSEATTTRSEASGERSMESSLCTTAASETTMSDSYTSSTTARTLHGRSPDSVHMDSYSEEGDLDSIALGGGSGLQQLAQQQSPGPRRRHRNSSGGKVGGGGSGGIVPHDVCKYSLTLSGITVAVLEANPAYTHPTDRYRCRKSESTQTYSSLDSCGLDPMCYLSEVANVLRAGVNRREIQRQRENLAQALPLDHLLVWFSTVKTGVSLQGSTTDLQLTVASCELWEFLYSNAANLPHITTPVSAALLIELLEDVALSQPCIRLKVSNSTDHATRKVHTYYSSRCLFLLSLY